jgi:hypothetical protein
MSYWHINNEMTYLYSSLLSGDDFLPFGEKQESGGTEKRSTDNWNEPDRRGTTN